MDITKNRKREPLWALNWLARKRLMKRYIKNERATSKCRLEPKLYVVMLSLQGKDTVGWERSVRHIKDRFRRSKLLKRLGSW